jgi:hypothetical protein
LSEGAVDIRVGRPVAVSVGEERGIAGAWFLFVLVAPGRTAAQCGSCRGV